MTIFQSAYLRAAVLALSLAVVGYLLVSNLAEAAAGLWLAIGLLLGGLLTPLSFLSQPATEPKAKTVSYVGEAQSEHQEDEVYEGETRTLYVGNLPYRANEAAVRKLFSEYGQVISVRLVKDKETGKRRGYGFVEMPEAQAQAAATALNETEYLQRTLKVRQANDKKETSSETAEN